MSQDLFSSYNFAFEKFVVWGFLSSVSCWSLECKQRMEKEDGTERFLWAVGNKKIERKERDVLVFKLLGFVIPWLENDDTVENDSSFLFFLMF